jgi:hypothetical protein
LTKFQHPAPPLNPQHAPHAWSAPVYGSRTQHAPHAWSAPVYGSRTPQRPTLLSNAPLLDSPGAVRIQSISDTFLYYGRACDPCILPALNKIATKKAAPTTATVAKTNMLMDYLHTYPNAVIRFYASDMILKITSDAAYLVLPKARSRAAVHYHLGWRNSSRVNGPVGVLCQTLQNVVSAAAEAETGGIYIGGKHACPMHAALVELGNPQPVCSSPFETDVNTAQGILNSKMRRKLSKAFDMRYWWMKDHIHQQQFDLAWAPDKLNLADYFTKHHPPWHHRRMRYLYLQRANSTQCAIRQTFAIMLARFHQEAITM